MACPPVMEESSEGAWKRAALGERSLRQVVAKPNDSKAPEENWGSEQPEKR